MSGRYKHQTGNAKIMVSRKMEMDTDGSSARPAKRLKARTARRRETNQKQTRLNRLARSLLVDVGMPHPP